MSRVVHFEIHAENPERAVQFYQKCFGWQIKKWDGPAEYWTIVTGPNEQPGIDGGLLPRHGPGPVEMQAVVSYVCTIQVASVDDTVKTVLANNGTLALPKMPIPGVGWLAYLKDTEGNIFGVMQPNAAAK
jgi:predicted enzyme related to lactoylglutathione lyase